MEYQASPGPQAHARFEEAESAGPPVRPLDFPPPRVIAGVRVNALVVHPETGARQVCSGVVHREDLNPAASANEPVSSSLSPAQRHRKDSFLEEVLAYWPQRRLQDAIYGSVWACLVLRRHYGVAADDAARAAGVEPGSASAPIVWEITGQHVAIKMVEWSRVHHMRGRLLEDPVKEVAAMQLLGARHPNVLGSTEVLQDRDFLYSVMPYCKDGDLFGVVVQYAEESGGEIGMPEPVARFWFRQILQVRSCQGTSSLAAPGLGQDLREGADSPISLSSSRVWTTCNEKACATETCHWRMSSSTETSA